MEHDGYLFRNKVIESVAPIRPRPIWTRPNVWPFLPLHVLFLTALLQPEFFFSLFGYNEETYLEQSTYLYPGVVFFAVVAALVHAIFLLLPMWSVAIRQRWAFSPALSFLDAKFVAVKPYPLKGKPTIVPLVQGDDAAAASHPLLRRDDSRVAAFFDFQGLKYFWQTEPSATTQTSAPLSKGSGAFARPAKVTQCTVGDLVACRGVPTDVAAEALRQQVGKNELIIPVPSFGELLKQHMKQPFFVFQCFQSILWLCDEYWYTAFVSVGLLVMFESVMVMQRMQQARSFQSIDRRGGAAFVLRRVKGAASATKKVITSSTGGAAAAPSPAAAVTPIAGDDDDADVLRAAAAAAVTDTAAVAAAEAQEAAAALARSRFESLEKVFGRVAAFALTGGVAGRTPKESTADGKGAISPCAVDDTAPPAEAEVGELHWVPVAASDLVPGDVFAFPVGGVVPCDAVLVGGNAITNEATLTGETVPQLKAPASSAPAMGARLRARGVHKTHILWSGTELVQASDDATLSSYPSVPTSHPSQSSQSGGSTAAPAAITEGDASVHHVVAVCVRTGFETKQGALVRTIVHANEPASVNSGEAYAFIGVLVCAALVASAYVLHTGLQDPSRNRWKLFVHCIMLVTLVVPTDVPMQLSMAIQTALLALVKDHATFCVEPFRVPAAGQATLVAFDKTGTLTSDSLTMVGIATLADGKAKAAGGDVLFSDATLPQQAEAALAAAELQAAQAGPQVAPATAAATPAGGSGGAPQSGSAASSTPPSLPPMSSSTPSSLVVTGILSIQPPAEADAAAYSVASVTRPGDVPAAAAVALAGCHSLSLQRKVYKMPRPRPKIGQPLLPPPPPREVVVPAGDPAETAAVAALGWSLKDPSTAVHASGATVKVVRRYPFTAELKRMSTVISAPAPFGAAVVMKGAPEVCKTMFVPSSVPSAYDSTCATLMRKGYRVLALGMKHLSIHEGDGGSKGGRGVGKAGATKAGSEVTLPVLQQHAKQLSRADAESGITFVGLAVFEANIKGEAVATIKALAASLHTPIMVTGDAVLTALAVSEAVGIVAPATDIGNAGAQFPSSSSPSAAPSMVPPHSPLSPTSFRALAPTSGPFASSRQISSAAMPGSGGGGTMQVETLVLEGDVSGLKVVVRHDGGRVAATAVVPSSRLASASEVASLDAVVAAILRSSAVVMDGASFAAVCSVAKVAGAGAVASEATAGVGKGVAAATSTSAAATTAATQLLDAIVARGRVFARCAPSAKVLVIDSFAKRGHTTVMCGDGTNDVGALRRADVGVALLPPVPPPPPPSKEEQAKLDAEAAERARKDALLTPQEKQQQQVKEMQQMLSDMWAGKPPGAAATAAQADQLAAAAASGAEIVETGVAKLGDASVAAPFTHRGPDVRGVVHLLRYGRSALVVTQRMYKIVALNSLASAYAHAILAHEGVRQSETQNIIFMILMTGGYFFLTRSYPLDALAPVRPHSRIFNPHLLLSVLGQFLLAFYVMLRVLTMVYESEPTLEEPQDLDDPFKPSLLNTCMFLVSAIANVATFTANYKGWPWMTGLKENKAMRTTLMGIGALCIFLAAEVMPELNEGFQFVPMPTDAFRQELVMLLVLHVTGAYAIEFVCDFVFGPKAPPGAAPGVVVPPLNLNPMGVVQPPAGAGAPAAGHSAPAAAARAQTYSPNGLNAPSR